MALQTSSMIALTSRDFLTDAPHVRVAMFSLKSAFPAASDKERRRGQFTDDLRMRISL